MFALKARPASLAAARRRTAGGNNSRRSSQIVRVAEFERKTADKVPKISVPAVDGGETPLDILNDGADAFAELVALNKPKQSVNRPQKVRSGRREGGDEAGKGADGTGKKLVESEWLDRWHADAGGDDDEGDGGKKTHIFETSIPSLNPIHRRSTSARTRRLRTATRRRPRSTKRWSTKGLARCCG